MSPIRIGKNLLLVVSVVALVSACSKTPEEHLEMAKLALQEDDTATATIELKNTIQKDAQNSEARTLLGKLRIRELNFEAAEYDLKQAMDFGDDSEDTQAAYLLSRLRNGSPNEVIGAYEGRAELGALPSAVLGQAYLATGDTEKARGALVNALGVKEGLLGMAQLSLGEGDSERSLKYLDQALAKDPSYVDALLLRGEVYINQGAIDESVAAFRAATDNPGGKIIARLGIVRAYLIGNQLEQALVAAEKLATPKSTLLQAHYLKALVLFRMQRWEDAESALQVIERMTREHLPTMHLMAATKYQLGKINEAQTRLEEYLEIDGSDISARKLLATVANQRGDYKTVVELLEPISLQQSDPQIWAMLGAALLRMDEHQSATEALENAVQLAPDMAAFRNELALSLFTAGDVEGATSELNNAIQVDSDQYQSDYLLAMVKVREGDHAGALEVVDELILRSPESPVGHNLLGNVHLAAGNLDQAKQAFEHALQKDPDFFPAARGIFMISQQQDNTAEGIALLESMRERGNETAALSLIDLKVSQGDFGGALTEAESVTESFPQSGPAWMGLARLQMATGQLGRASVSVDKALELTGETLDGLLLKVDIVLRRGKAELAGEVMNRVDQLAALSDGNLAALTRIAQMHMRMNNLTSARRYFEAVQEAAEAVPNEVYTGLASLELADKNFAAAQEHVNQLLQRGQTTEQVVLLQGEIHLARKNFDAAEAQFQSLADEGSRNGATRLVMLLIQRQDHARAVEVADGFLEKNVDDTLMKSLRATALVHQGDLATARAQYEAMMPSSDPVVLNNLAWIYMQEGDPKALETAQLAHSVAPENADIEDTLGWILVQKGQVEEGLSYLQSSNSNRPDNAAVLYHLGIAYQKAGQPRRAERALKRALSIGGFDDIEAARSALNEIESQS